MQIHPETPKHGSSSGRTASQVPADVPPMRCFFSMRQPSSHSPPAWAAVGVGSSSQLATGDAAELASCSVPSSASCRAVREQAPAQAAGSEQAASAAPSGAPESSQGRHRPQARAAHRQAAPFSRMCSRSFSSSSSAFGSARLLEAPARLLATAALGAAPSSATCSAHIPLGQAAPFTHRARVLLHCFPEQAQPTCCTNRRDQRASVPCSHTCLHRAIHN